MHRAAYGMANLELGVALKPDHVFRIGSVTKQFTSAAIMMLADWFLPFVYNIGFVGFQASVLVWLFLGGLVSLDNLPAPSPGGSDEAAQVAA